MIPVHTPRSTPAPTQTGTASVGPSSSPPESSAPPTPRLDLSGTRLAAGSAGPGPSATEALRSLPLPPDPGPSDRPRPLKRKDAGSDPDPAPPSDGHRDRKVRIDDPGPHRFQVGPMLKKILTALGARDAQTLGERLLMRKEVTVRDMQIKLEERGPNRLLRMLAEPQVKSALRQVRDLKVQERDAYLEAALPADEPPEPSQPESSAPIAFSAMTEAVGSSVPHVTPPALTGIDAELEPFLPPPLALIVKDYLLLSGRVSADQWKSLPTVDPDVMGEVAILCRPDLRDRNSWYTFPALFLGEPVVAESRLLYLPPQAPQAILAFGTSYAFEDGTSVLICSQNDLQAAHGLIMRPTMLPAGIALSVATASLQEVTRGQDDMGDLEGRRMFLGHQLGLPVTFQRCLGIEENNDPEIGRTRYLEVETPFDPVPIFEGLSESNPLAGWRPTDCQQVDHERWRWTFPNATDAPAYIQGTSVQPIPGLDVGTFTLRERDVNPDASGTASESDTDRQKAEK